MPDETRIMRNAQANLIGVQYQRIATLEARVDALAMQNTDLQADNDKLKAEIHKLREAMKWARDGAIQA